MPPEHVGLGVPPLVPTRLERVAGTVGGVLLEHHLHGHFAPCKVALPEGAVRFALVAVVVLADQRLRLGVDEAGQELQAAPAAASVIPTTPIPCPTRR